MGNGMSVDVPGGGSEGYQVLKVQPNSPGALSGLEPFFDYIIAINDQRLTHGDELRTIAAKNVGQALRLLVFSSKDQFVREVSLVPRDNWGGDGLLGISVRFTSFEGACENVWHILDVQPGSPAAMAQLQSNTDYVVCADHPLEDREDFFHLIQSHDRKPLRLYVYNSDTDSCREVVITPNSQWGGEGMLGCGIGYGYLHRIPAKHARSTENTGTTRAVAVPAVPMSFNNDAFTSISLATVAPTTYNQMQQQSHQQFHQQFQQPQHHQQPQQQHQPQQQQGNGAVTVEMSGSSVMPPSLMTAAPPSVTDTRATTTSQAAPPTFTTATTTPYAAPVPVSPTTTTTTGSSTTAAASTTTAPAPQQQYQFQYPPHQQQQQQQQQQHAVSTTSGMTMHPHPTMQQPQRQVQQPQQQAQQHSAPPMRQFQVPDVRSGGVFSAPAHTRAQATGTAAPTLSPSLGNMPQLVPAKPAQVAWSGNGGTNGSSAPAPTLHHQLQGMSLHAAAPTAATTTAPSATSSGHSGRGVSTTFRSLADDGQMQPANITHYTSSQPAPQPNA